MSSMTRSILRKQKEANLSKYLRKSYDNGYNKGYETGSVDMMKAMVEKLKDLHHVKGVSEKNAKSVIKYLELEDLM
ncbi:MAG TPA: hypothetical protein VK190_11315 [Pseudoneobacillus sp.]|nr:hypothetical protein [Pseudoneobacillus sp.]